MYKDTITVFNKRGKSPVSWYPTTLSDVEVQINKSANVTKTGVADADSAKLSVRYRLQGNQKIISANGGQEKIFVPPKEWDALNQNPSDFVTFKSADDFFIIGDYPDTVIADDEYSGGFFSFINKNKDYVYKISTVDIYKLIPHLEIGGK